MARITKSTLVIVPVIFIFSVFIVRKNSVLDSKFISSEKSTKSIVILLYNTYFRRTNWYLPKDTNEEDFFRSINCPVTNCIITSNRSYLPSLDSYHAVAFHYGEYEETSNCPSNKGQAFVFFIVESPAYTMNKVCTLDNYYSLTMTYRLDSDARAVYGGFADIATDEMVAPKLNPSWKLPENILPTSEEEKLLAITSKKTKKAAWFVSHCNVASKRDNLAKAMQKYIKVDIYGKCGTLSCPRKSDDCAKMLDDDYKFYFSFENSLCVDYVTEKLYEALKHYVVPIVLGGANYSLFAPPHSYINADDFKTAKDLANYLKYLDNNPKEYIKYFWWKKHYTVVNMYMMKYCELCKKLNQPETVPPKRFLKLDWWHNNTCYDNPKIKFV